jgi:hypothetical protein
MADVAVLHWKINSAAIATRSIKKELDYAARQFTAAQRRLNDAIEEARAARFVIGPGGSLSLPDSMLREPQSFADRLVLERRMTGISRRFKAALQLANTADRQVSTTLGRYSGEVVENPYAWLKHPNDVPGRRSLTDILHKYQVKDDPGGMTSFPHPALTGIYNALPTADFDSEDVTQAEADFLNSRSMSEILKADEIKTLASHEALSRFGKDSDSEGQGDAFRHAYWNALMHSELGSDWSETLTTAHEGIPGNPGIREAMDLHNNEVGRQIAREHPGASREELANHVQQAVREGRMVVINRDLELSWSDREVRGDNPTREQVGGQPAQPGHDPDLPYPLP